MNEHIQQKIINFLTKFKYYEGKHEYLTDSFFCVFEYKQVFTGFIDIASVETFSLDVYCPQDAEKTRLPFYRRIFNRPRKLLKIVHQNRHTPDERAGHYFDHSGDLDLLGNVILETYTHTPNLLKTEE